VALARLEDLVGLDDAAFRTLFAKSPVKRIGRDRLVRNVLYALGNSREARHVPAIMPHLDDRKPLVRGAAVWALSRLLVAGDFSVLKADRAGQETDPSVLLEWTR